VGLKVEYDRAFEEAKDIGFFKSVGDKEHGNYFDVCGWYGI
jgi:hypothetical protein